MLTGQCTHSLWTGFWVGCRVKTNIGEPDKWSAVAQFLSSPYRQARKNRANNTHIPQHFMNFPIGFNYLYVWGRERGNSDQSEQKGGLLITVFFLSRDLSGNKLGFIEEGVFNGLPKLSTLWDKIFSISVFQLTNFKKLIWTLHYDMNFKFCSYLSENRISSLESESFRGLPSLKHL